MGQQNFLFLVARVNPFKSGNFAIDSHGRGGKSNTEAVVRRFYSK